VIAGSVPNPARFPSGCRFHPRCPVAVARCREAEPPLESLESGHAVRCWRAGEIAAGALDPVRGEARA
jgi:oligopeptide/dipeptide ABC transporter ATP-binding protein